MPSQRKDSDHQDNKLADGGRNPTDEAARTARRATDEAARAGEQTAHAGADVLHRSSETARDDVQQGLNTATQSFQQITDQFMQVLAFNGPQTAELAQRWSEKVQALAQASTVQAQGTQKDPQEVCGLVQDRLTTDIEAVNHILGSPSVQDFVADQSDPVRERLQEMIDANRRMGELVIRIAEQMGQIIQAQASRNANQPRHAA
jgi:hypothetical protein